jgi:hypothetical protein
MSRPSAEGGGQADAAAALVRGSKEVTEGASPAGASSREAGTATVRRRHVFYLSGFDPKGPAHYHRLYADEAAKAAALGGYTVQVGKRRKLSEHSAGWSVEYRGPAAADSDPVHTEVEFLRWDDIVREHWPRHPGVLAWDLVVTTWLYLRTGALWTMYRLSWPPVVALVVPVLILLALVLAVPASAALGWAVGRASGSALGGVLAAVALLGGAFALARLAERKLNMQWLLRSYAFTGRQGTTGWPVLEARLDAFAQAIADRVHAARSSGGAAPSAGAPGSTAQDASTTSDAGELAAAHPPARAKAAPAAPADEVLIVAHSSGSIMAAAALARALALDPLLTQRGARVALLTLGQWIPLLTSLPSAHGFRAELDRLARDPALDWVDFTAPPDGCCFALTNPFTAAGLPPARANHPRLLSPRFAAMFSPAAYAEIKRDRFRLHFQYLMASELPGDYDYTAITAGPVTLGARFAGQASIDDFAQFRR